MTIEPILQLDDIQGLALPGFLKPHQTLINLKIPNDEDALARQCSALQALVDTGALSSARCTLYDRRAFRRGRQTPSVLLGVAFSASGLDKLSERLSATVPGPAFRAGMRLRASLLGDPDPDKTPWHAGFGSRQPEALLVVAGNERAPVDACVDQLAALLHFDKTGPGVWPGGHAPDRLGREHFGFMDGISQPAIRGRRNVGAASFIHARTLPPGDPEHDLFGYPGQHRVWPGEFVLGYPASGPDPRRPGPVRQVPPWMFNGSFLVYRRLQQNVAGFRSWLLQQAATLRDFPGFEGLSVPQAADKLAARLVGRWPSGAPLARAPDHDIPALGEDPHRNNDFRFDDETPQRPHLDRTLPALPTAVADILGMRCPVHAHIRKVNVRDQASDVGGSSATYARRLLRVGVPYGEPLPEGRLEDDGIDRGLLFLSIQASIEDQFEFLQARWINSGTRPRAPGGHDMLVGQNAAAPGGVRRCTLFSPDLSQHTEIQNTQSFVTMTGGGYMFVPSLTALRWLLAQGGAVNPG